MPDKEYKYFIDPLAAKMGINHIRSKRILTAIVYGAMHRYGYITEANIKEVRAKFTKGLCDDFDLEVFELALDSGKLENLLCKKERKVNPDTIYAEFIYPFMHEVAGKLGISVK